MKINVSYKFKRPGILTVFLLLYRVWAQVPTAPANPPADERYKTDILLIVAHPDDDSSP